MLVHEPAALLQGRCCLTAPACSCDAKACLAIKRLSCRCLILIDVCIQIRVFCRLKPHPDPAISILADGASVSTRLPDGKEAKFTYDKVFEGGAKQEAVFHEVSELVQSALDGYQVRKSINASRRSQHAHAGHATHLVCSLFASPCLHVRDRNVALLPSSH